MIDKHFIPAAEDSYAKGRNPEERGLFQKLSASNGGGLGQSVYVVTPSGQILARYNGNWKNDVYKVYLKLFSEALDKWKALPKQARMLPKDPPGVVAGSMHAHLYPADGLVLQVFARDLPRDPAKLNDLSQPPEGYQLGGKWGSGNRDAAWFTRAEVKSMIPADKQAGTRHKVPAKLAQRLARYHLIDMVIGTAHAFAAGEVKKADLFTVVKGTEGEMLHLTIEGVTRAEGTRKKVSIGYEAKLVGQASYHLKEERFLRFDLLAVGTRWGPRDAATNAKQEAASPMGVAFRLAPSTGSVSRMPPAAVARHKGKYFD